MLHAKATAALMQEVAFFPHGLHTFVAVKKYPVAQVNGIVSVIQVPTLAKVHLVHVTMAAVTGIP